MSRALAPRGILLISILLAPAFSAGLAPGLARAQEVAPAQALRAIRELTLRARFEEAIATARRFVDRDDLDATERNAGLEALAVAQIANRQSQDAEQTLQLLYSRDPGHRLTDPDASPPVLSAFARARESRPEQVPVRLEHTPPALARRESPEIVVRVSEGDDTAVAEVRLVYRLGEDSARVVMTARPDGSFAARIPVVGEATRATDVAYHIVALAPSLTPLAGVGSAAEPLQLRIPAEAPAIVPREERPPVLSEREPAPPPSGGSVVEEWWFWTLILGVVAAGAVTTGVLLGPAQEGPEPGTLGSVRLMQIELP